jgi:hypothetical protein
MPRPQSNKNVFARFNIDSGGSEENHPADRDNNYRIDLSEITIYQTAFKKGHNWDGQQINSAYVLKAEEIFKKSGNYIYNPGAGECPACYVVN